MGKHVVTIDGVVYKGPSDVGHLTARRGETIELSDAEARRLTELEAVVKEGSDEAKAAVAAVTAGGRVAPEGGDPAHADVDQFTEPGTRTVLGRAVHEAMQADEDLEAPPAPPEIVHGEAPGSGTTSRGAAATVNEAVKAERKRQTEAAKKSSK